MAPVDSSTTIRQMEHKNKGNLVIGIGPTFTPLKSSTAAPRHMRSQSAADATAVAWCGAAPIWQV